MLLIKVSMFKLNYRQCWSWNRQFQAIELDLTRIPNPHLELVYQGCMSSITNMKLFKGKVGDGVGIGIISESGRRMSRVEELRLGFENMLNLESVLKLNKI